MTVTLGHVFQEADTTTRICVLEDRRLSGSEEDRVEQLARNTAVIKASAKLMAASGARRPFSTS